MESVLKQVDLVVAKYREVEKISGENFNIFSIMGMESDEVRTHSALLAELLDPNGSHGLGAEPLELLIEQLYPEGIGLDYKTATCGKEVYAGKINEDYTEGGRIDLLIKDNDETRLIIENKIYAPEQKNQLLRYKQRFPHAKLLFLTLDGKESDELEIEYHTISYKEDILNWIENCAKLAWNRPMVREVLVHYVYLIKILTNQTTNKKMSKEIITIIQSNFEASDEIYKNYEKALVSKQLEYLNELKDNLSSKIPTGFPISIGETYGENSLIIHCGENRKLSYRFKRGKHPVTRIEFKAGANLKNPLSEFKDFKESKDKESVVYWKIENNGFNLDYFKADYGAKRRYQTVIDLLSILDILNK